MFSLFYVSALLGQDTSLSELCPFVLVDVVDCQLLFLSIISSFSVLQVAVNVFCVLGLIHLRVKLARRRTSQIFIYTTVACLLYNAIQLCENLHLEETVHIELLWHKCAFLDLEYWHTASLEVFYRTICRLFPPNLLCILLQHIFCHSVNEARVRFSRNKSLCKSMR